MVKFFGRKIVSLKITFLFIFHKLKSYIKMQMFSLKNHQTAILDQRFSKVILSSVSGKVGLGSFISLFVFL